MHNSPPDEIGRLYLHRNLQILFGVTLMAVMGVSSIAPALPVMLDALSITPAQAWWLISAFTLPGVLFTPVFGVLADRFGRKRVLVPALACFGVFGGLCAMTTKLWVLLLLRFMQGVGASSLGALNATIISDMYSGRERLQAMGYNASVLSIGTTIFPLLGGALAAFGWRCPFLLPLLALPLAVVVWRWLDAPEPRSNGAFMEYMRSAARMAATPRVLALFLTTAATFIILYGVIIAYLPIHLARNFHADPTSIGIVIAASSFTSATVATQLGTLSRRFRSFSLLVVAFMLYAASALLLPLMPDMWAVILPVLLFGVAQALNIPNVQAMLAGLAPMEQRGAFMALNGMVLRVGQTLGPLVMGGAYALWGLDGVFATGAGLAVCVCVMLLALVRGGR
ncbi:MFS family permease [Desulfobaculum xiamenense]|uniref:MFS family permease n=1 Tax=Desulfobaculum xiamenense TaxID=995050 RepID=A0A846QFT4_9BACT|nr:MFS transporter [Desulfobaculum xiamenense]NJB67656.1 MFS family permease [Desulfobaculum xiamenense]